ncbi:MAG: ion transporter [Solirubrobacterales bacterium]
MADRCERIAESGRFQGFIIAVILANAVVLGLQTYDAIERDAASLLRTLDHVFLGIFVVELAIRLLAYGTHLRDFFRNGWNVFAFVVISAAFIPGLRENVTLLRLVRLLRVVRIISVLPDLRVLIRGMVKSLLPIGTMAIVGVLLMYVYGMVGWILFSDELPAQWGTIGEAMLTLFVVMTLENFPQYMEEATAVHPQAWIYFVSYVLIASFLVINVLIAIIINSIEEARRDESLEAVLGGRPGGEDGDLDDDLKRAGASLSARERAVIRVHALREALADLEAELGTADETVGVASKGRMRP